MDFDTKIPMRRLKLFDNRVRKIAEIFEIMVEFGRLEKIDVGGTKVIAVLLQLLIR
jgi:hypothetical protein